MLKKKTESMMQANEKSAFGRNRVVWLCQSQKQMNQRTMAFLRQTAGVKAAVDEEEVRRKAAERLSPGDRNTANRGASIFKSRGVFAYNTAGSAARSASHKNLVVQMGAS